VSKPSTTRAKAKACTCSKEERAQLDWMYSLGWMEGEIRDRVLALMDRDRKRRDEADEHVEHTRRAMVAANIAALMSNPAWLAKHERTQADACIAETISAAIAMADATILRLGGGA
jgi:hypothetical protein